MENDYQEERDFIKSLLDKTDAQYKEYLQTIMQKKQKNVKNKSDDK